MECFSFCAALFMGEEMWETGRGRVAGEQEAGKGEREKEEKEAGKEEEEEDEGR